MKKNCFLTLLCLGMLLMAREDSFAQNDYKKGSVLINPGLGLGYYYGGGFAVGLSANAEFSITDDIAIGPYFAFTRWNYGGYAGYGGDFKYTFIDFGARGSYHFARLLKVNNDKFDPYAGAFLGFVSSSYSSSYGSAYNDAYGGTVRGGVYAGARWYFTDKFAAFGEVGVGLYPIFVGISFRIK